MERDETARAKEERREEMEGMVREWRIGHLEAERKASKAKSMAVRHPWLMRGRDPT